MTGNPERVGPYRILETIGRGGFGIVYRARDESLRRDVAVKVLQVGELTANHGDSSGIALHLLRFRREMLAMAALSHPGLVRIYDAGEDGENPWIAMELLHGRTLRVVSDERPLPVLTAVAHATRIAEAVAVLHDAGIIHRDLKPENIVLTDQGQIKVLDLGLVRMQTATGLTMPHVFVGTPAYAAPEMISGAGHDHRVDIYQIGLVLYRLLTARLPFSPESLPGMLLRVLSEDAPPPRTFNERIPPAVDQLVVSCLARDRERRPPTAQALRELLEAAVRPASRPPARTVAAVQSPPDSANPRSFRVAGAAALLAGALGALAMTLRPATVAPAAVTRATGAPAAMTRATVAPAAVTRATGAPAAGAPVTVTTAPFASGSFWSTGDLVRPRLARLRAGGDTARKAVAELEEAAGMTLGGGRELWLHWEQLSRWIFAPPDGSAPPRHSRADTGAVPDVECRLRITMMRDALRESPRAYAATLVRAVTWNPDDGRFWLGLGRLLEQDGLAQASRKLYAHGLARLTPGAITDFPDPFWLGLFRALEQHGRRIEDEWTRWHGGNPPGLTPYAALATYWTGDGPRLIAFLDRLHPDSDPDGNAGMMLGRFLTDAGRPERAREVWEAALQRHPQQAELRRALVDHLLQRGWVARARKLLPGSRHPAHTPAHLDALEAEDVAPAAAVGGSEAPPPGDGPDAGIARALWLSRHGRIAESVRSAEALVLTGLRPASVAAFPEIMFRAAWLAHRGGPTEPEWNRNICPVDPTSEHPIHLVYSGLSKRDFARATRGALSAMDAEPGTLSWLLIAVWAADLAGDEAALRELLTRALPVLRVHRAEPILFDTIRNVKSSRGAPR